MEELQNIINYFDFENFRYFYHITEKGKGQKILEDGLFMVDSNLYSTTIEVPFEMIKNPIEFCKDEYCGRQSSREEMIIIECIKDEEENLVIKNDKLVWNSIDEMGYKILPKNIVCYIDLKSLEVIYNENRNDFDNIKENVKCLKI